MYFSPHFFPYHHYITNTVYIVASVIHSKPEVRPQNKNTQTVVGSIPHVMCCLEEKKNRSLSLNKYTIIALLFLFNSIPAICICIYI